mgnify:CR=1 FL=1
MKGRFIVFEGLDGSGKTTQMRLAAERLRALGYDCVTEFEPTDGEIGCLIRRALKGEIEMGTRAIAQLFAADRSDHVRRMKAEVDSGKIVLCDRYIYSNVAYQGKYIDKDEILMYNSVNISSLLPDTVFFVDVSAKECINRISANRASSDIYEKLDILKSVRENYMYCFACDFNKGVNVVTVDGERPASEIADEIVSVILSSN